MSISPNLLKKLARTCLWLSAILFVIDYFFFHYVTLDGITFIKQYEAGKPFITNLIGTFAVNMLSVSIVSFLLARLGAEQ